jgi:hypothetical protein
VPPVGLGTDGEILPPDGEGSEIGTPNRHATEVAIPGGPEFRGDDPERWIGEGFALFDDALPEQEPDAVVVGAMSTKAAPRCSGVMSASSNPGPTLATANAAFEASSGQTSAKRAERPWRRRASTSWRSSEMATVTPMTMTTRVVIAAMVWSSSFDTCVLLGPDAREDSKLGSVAAWLVGFVIGGAAIGGTALGRTAL